METIRQEKQLFKQNYLQTRKTVACGGSGFQICVSKDWIAERNKRPKLTQTPHAHRLATLIPRLADSPMFAAQLLLQEAQHPGEVRGFPARHLTHLPTQASHPTPTGQMLQYKQLPPKPGKQVRAEQMGSHRGPNLIYFTVPPCKSIF